MTPAEKNAVHAAIEMLSEVSAGRSPDAVAINDLIFRLQQMTNNRALSQLEAGILRRIEAMPMTSNQLRATFNRTHTSINSALKTLHQRKMIHVHAYEMNGGTPLRWWAAGNSKDAERPIRLSQKKKAEALAATAKKAVERTRKPERPAEDKPPARLKDDFVPRRDPAAAWF